MKNGLLGDSVLSYHTSRYLGTDYSHYLLKGTLQ